LTGFQTHIRRESRTAPGILTLTTILCLILLALLAVVQVTHLHPSQSEADRCPLCIVMHSAVPIAVAAAAVVLVQVGVSAPRVEPIPVRVHRHPKLFIRPPPAGC
jgi:TRAP-type C4-dicarboxylate transport system permease small subunit